MRAPHVVCAAVCGCAFLFPGGADASPKVSVSPAQLAFGQACVGAPTPPSAVTVTNTGDEPLEVSGISTTGADAGDFRVTGGEARTLAPGASFQFGVSFTPSVPGARAAAATISSNGGSGQVSLSGEGVTRALSINPSRLIFGDQRVGTSSDDLSITLSNTGSARLTLTSTILTGDFRRDYVLRGPSQSALNPGESTSLSVVFRPRAVKARPADIDVVSDACAGRTRIPLSGTGTAPDVRVAPATIDLGHTAIGSSAEAVSVVVRNAGRAPLRLTRVQVAGQAASDFLLDGVPALPTVLGPGKELLFTAAFTPSIDGPREAVLRIDSDDPDSPSLHVPLVGNRLTTESASPSPSELEEPPQSSLRRRAQRAGPVPAGRGGGGDWFAVAVVLILGLGTFGLLFAIGRRRTAVHG